ncbi:hypothetical protein HDV00_012458 [Rhizophlyctis rosea]|nr:hypothetical protein HDV00_012458 [Rhizophlyctis rosea]
MGSAEHEKYETLRGTSPHPTGTLTTLWTSMFTSRRGRYILLACFLGILFVTNYSAWSPQTLVPSSAQTDSPASLPISLEDVDVEQAQLDTVSTTVPKKFAKLEKSFPGVEWQLLYDGVDRDQLPKFNATSKYAYVTIMAGDTRPARALAMSLLLTGHSKSFNVIVPLLKNGSRPEVPQDELDELTNMGVRIHYTPQLNIPIYAFRNKWNWVSSYERLHAFNMTEFEKILYLDSDITILQNIDDLFALPVPVLGWTYNDYNCFKKNGGSFIGGTFIFEPSSEGYETVLSMLDEAMEEWRNNENGTWKEANRRNGTQLKDDQHLLKDYFRVKYGAKTYTQLPPSYQQFPILCTCFEADSRALLTWRRRIKIMHYAWMAKPFGTNFMSVWDCNQIVMDALVEISKGAQRLYGIGSGGEVGA